MSAEKTITVACEACGVHVQVPNDAVGELYAIDFTERHTHDPHSKPLSNSESTDEWGSDDA